MRKYIVGSILTGLCLGVLSLTLAGPMQPGGLGQLGALYCKLTGGGDCTFSGQILAATGAATAGNVSYGFTGDTNTGMFSTGADGIGFSTNGTQKLSIGDTGGLITSTLAVVLPVGAVGAPALYFTGDVDTGLYSSTAANIDFTTSGTNRLKIADAAITPTVQILAPTGAATAGNVSYSFTGDTDTGIYEAGPNAVGVALNGANEIWVGTTGTTFVHGIANAVGSAGAPSYAFTGDLDTGISAATANTLSFDANGHEKATCDDTNFTLKEHLLFSADGTYDIGASAATRPRTGYYSTSVDVSRTGLTTNTVDGALLRNTTVALVGEKDQVSPSLEFEGHTWDDNDARSDGHYAEIDLVPAHANTSTSKLSYRFKKAANETGGSYSEVASLDNSGTFTAVNLAQTGTQTANTIYAGPVTGAAAAPAFRGLVTADIPDGVTNTSYCKLTGGASCAMTGDITMAGAAVDLTVTNDGLGAALGTTPANTQGELFTNTTAAVAGPGVTVQVPPAVTLHGSAWETAGPSNDTWDWRMSMLPATGANSTSTLQFHASKDGAAYGTPVATLTNSGKLGLSATYSAGTLAANYTSNLNAIGAASLTYANSLDRVAFAARNTTQSVTDTRVQSSPAILLEGHAWDTTNSNDVKWEMRESLIPITFSYTTSGWAWDVSKDEGAWINAGSLDVMYGGAITNFSLYDTGGAGPSMYSYMQYNHTLGQSFFGGGGYTTFQSDGNAAIIKGNTGVWLKYGTDVKMYVGASSIYGTSADVWSIDHVSGQFASPRNESVLARVTNIDMQNPNDQVIFACPSGKTCVVTKVILRNPTSTAAALAGDIGWGAGGAGLVAFSNDAGFTATTQMRILLPAATAVSIGAASTNLNINFSALSAGAGTVTVDVIGFWN